MSPWTALAGDARADLHRIVTDIATALADPGGPAAADPSLADGQAGFALFFGHRALATGDAADDARADDALAIAFDLLGAAPAVVPGLFLGFTGAAWVHEHLARLRGDDGSLDACDDVDELLRELLVPGTWRGHYDLINGLVGFGVYALERRVSAARDALLGGILDWLDGHALVADGGVTWRTTPTMSRAAAVAHPDGHLNLGVAHGVPGVIGLLAAATIRGVHADRCRALLTPAVRWMLGHHRRDPGRAAFACTVGDDGDNRAAWCYGDPGVAAALGLAADALGRDDWRAEARALALHAASRPLVTCGIFDASLCHGAAGLAHTLARLGERTPDPGLTRIAAGWCQAIPGLRHHEGVAGFRSFTPVPDEARQWRPDAGFLTGAAGVGLAALAALSDAPPSWDRVFLLSA